MKLLLKSSRLKLRSRSAIWLGISAAFVSPNQCSRYVQASVGYSQGPRRRTLVSPQRLLRKVFSNMSFEATSTSLVAGIHTGKPTTAVAVVTFTWPCLAPIAAKCERCDVARQDRASAWRTSQRSVLLKVEPRSAHRRRSYAGGLADHMPPGADRDRTPCKWWPDSHQA